MTRRYIFLFTVAVVLGGVLIFTVVRLRQRPLDQDVRLHCAARDGNVEVVRQLLAEGVNVNAHHEYPKNPFYWKWTPLHYATSSWQQLGAGQSYFQIIELLLEHGANPNAGTGYGARALHMLHRQGEDLRLVQLLVSHGADVNTKSNEGDTPLHELSSSPDSVEYLLQKGADPNAATDGGRTPLHNANSSVTRLLMQYGANPNVKDKNGKTPLHRAASSGDVKKASLLIEAGADLNARSKWKKTPLGVALGQRKFPMVAFLREKGGIE